MDLTKKKQKPMYRECMKNHAAAMGAHAVDGCGEYIPSLSSNMSDVTSLVCAACGCHRNFHRQPQLPLRYDYDFDEAEEDEATRSDVLVSMRSPPPTEEKKKRCRTKFSEEQKEAMVELANKVGWKLPRKEEGIVEETCKRIGIERGVFKVWMHNHKPAFLGSKPKVDDADVVAANAKDDGGEKQQVNTSGGE